MSTFAHTISLTTTWLGDYAATGHHSLALTLEVSGDNGGSLTLHLDEDMQQITEVESHGFSEDQLNVTADSVSISGDDALTVALSPGNLSISDSGGVEDFATEFLENAADTHSTWSSVDDVHTEFSINTMKPLSDEKTFDDAFEQLLSEHSSDMAANDAITETDTAAQESTGLTDTGALAEDAQHQAHDLTEISDEDAMAMTSGEAESAEVPDAPDQAPPDDPV